MIQLLRMQMTFALVNGHFVLPKGFLAPQCYKQSIFIARGRSLPEMDGFLIFSSFYFKAKCVSMLTGRNNFIYLVDYSLSYIP